jgi:predicted dehydrogenase
LACALAETPEFSGQQGTDMLEFCTMDVINVAQIGVGYWGPNLLRNLAAHSSCEVACVVDFSEERRRFVTSHYPAVQAHSDPASIFNDAEIQAVVIATPAGTHFQLAMKALESGKHVLVEKPLATSVEEVDKIAALAKSKNLVAMVGHTFLFNPAVRYLKGLIDSGELGDIRYIYSQRLNLGRIRSDVDALWNLAPHDISIIHYLLGDPEPSKIRRSGMDFVQSGIDDVVFLNIEYPGKIMAHVHVSWLDPHKVRCITVVGSKKMVIYDDMAENKISIYDKGIDPKAVLGESMDYDKGQPPVFTHRAGDILIPKIQWSEPLKNEISHFLDCIQGKTECLTGPAHARKVVEVLQHA